MFDEFSSHLAPLVQMLKKDQKVSQKVWLVHFTELSHNWNQQWERETKRMMHSETKTSFDIWLNSCISDISESSICVGYVKT